MPNILNLISSQRRNYALLKASFCDITVGCDIMSFSSQAKGGGRVNRWVTVALCLLHLLLLPGARLPPHTHKDWPLPPFPRSSIAATPPPPSQVCILQGPVAAAHSRVVNQPIKELLDDIWGVA